MKLTPRQQRAKDYSIKRKYAKDLVQPSNPLFKKYYPKQYNEMENTIEQIEFKKKQEKQSKEQFFNKYKTSVHSQQMRNTLKLEDKLEENGNR